MNVIKPVANFIIKNKAAQNAFKFASNNPSLFESGTVFALSTTIRPATMYALPTNKEDKKYYMARSIITGCLDLLTSSVYYVPLGKYIKNITPKLQKMKGTIFYNNPESIKALNTLFNRGSKFFTMVLQAMLLFYAIPRLVNRICGDKKMKEVKK